MTCLLCENFSIRSEACCPLARIDRRAWKLSKPDELADPELKYDDYENPTTSLHCFSISKRL